MRLLVFFVALASLVQVSQAAAQFNSTQEAQIEAEVKEQAEVIASKMSLESAFEGFKGDDNKFEKVDEQTRVDTLVRALKRLPEGELSNYGLTSTELEQIYSPGTKETEKLFAAWNIRQGELKRAMDSMMKPAEYMQDLVKFIVPSYQGREVRDKKEVADEGPQVQGFKNRVDALEQLENLVEDIDNARDFNAVGGFRAITRALLVPPFGSQGFSLEERSLAASVIGNAVKNDYDFQLWVLEEEAECLRGLLSMLCSERDDIARRRALYAIASASRGNSDVQEYILGMASTSSESSLSACLMEILQLFVASAEDRQGQGQGQGQAGVSVELARKALAFISDMLGEYAFLQQQIKNPRGLEIDVGADGALGDAAVAGELMSQLHAIRPLGPAFCSEDWRVLTIKTLDRASSLLLAAVEGLRSADKGKGKGKGSGAGDTRGKDKDKRGGWLRTLLSAVTADRAEGGLNGSEGDAKSMRALVSACRGALENALSVFLASGEVCEPEGHVYSSTVGSDDGPGAVVASAKARLLLAQAWAASAAEAAGGLEEQLTQALRYFD